MRLLADAGTARAVPSSTAGQLGLHRGSGAGRALRPEKDQRSLGLGSGSAHMGWVWTHLPKLMRRLRCAGPPVSGSKAPGVARHAPRTACTSTVLSDDSRPRPAAWRATSAHVSQKPQQRWGKAPTK